MVVADQLICSGFVGNKGNPGSFSFSDDSVDAELFEGKAVFVSVYSMQDQIHLVSLIDCDITGVPTISLDVLPI